MIIRATETVDVIPALRVPTLVMAAVIGACTFPDVDYADGGSVTSTTGSTTSTTASGGSGGSDGSTGSTSSSTGMMCPAPSNCANDAVSCANSASNKNKNCTNHCQPNDQACLDQCAATRTGALATCAAVCESCAAPTCGSSPTNCDAIVGH